MGSPVGEVMKAGRILRARLRLRHHSQERGERRHQQDVQHCVVAGTGILARQPCTPRRRPRHRFCRTRRALIAAFACSIALTSCGGGGGSAGGTPGVPAPGVDGPAWWSTVATGSMPRRPRSRRRTSTASRGRPRSTSSAPRQANGTLLIHYGSPVVTSHNTVVVPVKTGVGGGLRRRGKVGRATAGSSGRRTATTCCRRNWVPTTLR